jgi:hypothetical protein
MHSLVTIPELAVEGHFRAGDVPLRMKSIVLVWDALTEAHAISQLYGGGVSGQRAVVETSPNGGFHFRVPAATQYRGNMFPFPIRKEPDRVLVVASSWPDGPAYQLWIRPKGISLYRFDRHEHRFREISEHTSCKGITATLEPRPYTSADKVTVRLSLEELPDTCSQSR